MTITTIAQTTSSIVCGDDKMLALQRELLPNYEQRIQENNLKIKEYINRTFVPSNNRSVGVNGITSYGMGLAGDSIYTIPVVIHIIYPNGEAYGSGTNISYAQIRTQLEALNAAFSKSYPSYNGQVHPAYAQNAKIQFCLARNIPTVNTQWAVGPRGGIEYGVMRYADKTGAYNHTITVASANDLLAITHPGKAYFPFDKYLNIWLVKTIDGGNNVMGYAPRPLMGIYPIDGIVLRADIFGDNTTGGNFALGFNLMEGKILAHEMGHYLNLYHIFQGGCAGTNGPGAAIDACDLNGDYICDIKPCTTQNILCSSGNYSTCNANYDPGTTQFDMINDYMSYANDDCMNTFTLNQVQRMWATLQLQRQSLWQASNLAYAGVISNGGCVPPYLNASINVDGVFCTGTAIHLSNPLAGNTAIHHKWQLAGATPSISNSDTVTVFYNAAGNYKIILTVSDSINSFTDSITITVTTCQMDSTLKYMSHWYFGDYCSLDFSTGTPVKTTTAYTNNSIHGEYAYSGQPLPFIGSTISLSDSLGSLLFYSNGVSVWNSSHKKITSTSIFGTADINAGTGICYVPFPGHPNKYFIVGAYPNLNGNPSGIRYVLVDVAANTVSAYQEFQNTLLPNRFSEHLTVVPHCNGSDYWIIVKGYGMDSDNNFYCLLVNSTGINNSQVPVVSKGFSHPGYSGGGNELKANRAGDKLVLSSPHGYINIEEAVLYDFDSRTGMITNEKVVSNVNGYSNIQSGTAFSPSGEYFYIMRSSNFVTNGAPYWLFQYRVNDLSYTIIPTKGFYFGSAFQIGPDNKLYITNTGVYLARLTNPDDFGGGTFEEEFINFSRPNSAQPVNSSLPAFIDAKRKDPIHPDFTKQVVSCKTFVFTSVCFDNYISTWDFGDGAATQTGSSVIHTYAKSGEYTVMLTISNSVKTYGTVSKKISVVPQSIQITGPDTICSTNNFATQFFSPVISNASYKWIVTNGTISGFNNLPYVSINWPQLGDSGKIRLQVSTGDSCTIEDSRTVIIIHGLTPDWLLQDSICITDKAINLSATPAGGIFSGPGIINGIFTPDLAGLGNHILTYTLNNGTNCNNEIQKIIKVYDGCNIIIPPSGGTASNAPIPNVFTPNGDGINDTWRVKFLDSLPNAVVNIFNRYGQLVFKTVGYNRDWDGKYNGHDLPIGTYFYVIIPNINMKPISGSVSILR